jgi:HSP20 family protein
MANIARKGQAEQESRGSGLASRDPFQGVWDPFQMMRQLMRGDPLGGMLGGGMMGGGERMFAPDIEVKETKDAFVFKADLPGVKEDDISIDVTGNRLSISGKRETEKEEGDERYHTYERSYGTFNRSFVLPEGVDLENIDASLKDGVLRLVVPKKPEVQPRRISLGGKPAGEGGAMPTEVKGQKAANEPGKGTKAA